MSKRFSVCLSLMFVGFLIGAIPLAGIAQTPTGKAATEKATVNAPFKDFTLRNMSVEATDKSDASVTLSSFRDKKVIVAMFMANRCGATWTYEEKIGKLLKDYADKDVEIVAIHSNYEESDQEIRAQFEQRNLKMAILDDKPTQAFATYSGATVTPTFVIIDKKGVLRFRGAFDKFSDDKIQYVRPALDAVLSGKAVTVQTTRSLGCGISWRKSPASQSAAKSR